MNIIPARDIRSVLIDGGITVPIFINQEQDTGPFPALTIRRYGGAANPHWARDQILLQVRCKGEAFGAESAEELLYQTRDILLGLETIKFLPEYDYIRFLLVSDVAYIGVDDENRPIFTLNFEVTVDWKIPVGNREPIN